MTSTEFSRIARVTAPPALITAEALLTYQQPDNKRTELVRGRLVVREPPGMFHGQYAARVVVAISNYLTRDRASCGAEQTRGRVLTCDPGFTLARNPDTVRAPDVAYVSRARWAGPMPHGYGEFAPDLAVEIQSPNDRPGAVLAKVGDWLNAGSLLVWVIDPIRRSVAIYRADGSHALLNDAESLEGGDVLPGFSYALAELLAE
jgi:Uma2 family endonuclease